MAPSIVNQLANLHKRRDGVKVKVDNIKYQIERNDDHPLNLFQVDLLMGRVDTLIHDNDEIFDEILIHQHEENIADSGDQFTRLERELINLKAELLEKQKQLTITDVLVPVPELRRKFK